MGNCWRKKEQQTTLQRIEHCQHCGRVFANGSAIADYLQHTQSCRQHQVVQPIPQHHPPMQLQNIPVHSQIEIQIMEQQPIIPRQQRINPGQFIMDDFRNNNQKLYWCKELQPGSTIHYKWVQKPVPPLPVNSVQDMLAVPWNQIKVAQFPTKQTWFRLNLEKLRVPWQQGSDTLYVAKDSFLMTTLNTFKEVNWHKEVKVHIEGDKVLDAGGLLREWAVLIMKEVIHKESGMFQRAETDDVCYKINGDADVCEHIIDCFKLLGTVVGKCIFERIPINVYFDRSILKHILGQTVQLQDIHQYDINLYKSWDFIISNKFDANDLCEYFAIYRGSKRDIYELKPDGSKIQVDMDNCQEYVNLCIDYYTYKSVQPFLTAFLNQLYSIVPKKLLSVFDPVELEMILYGVPFINLEDWKNNTEFKGAYYRNHQVIVWFWEVLAEFDQLTLAKFLQFCTGSQRTPVEGFRKLESNRGNCSKYCIESVAYSRANPYPKAHTCFNRLELPMYESKDVMQQYLVGIVNADIDGVFGME